MEGGVEVFSKVLIPMVEKDKRQKTKDKRQKKRYLGWLAGWLAGI
jgi:hypothetical protein